MGSEMCIRDSHVLAFNAPVAAEKTAAILNALGLETSSDDKIVRKVAMEYCASLGVEMRMSARGVPKSDLEAMADEAFAIKRLIDNNPRALTRKDILEIYDAAYGDSK